MNQVRSQNWVGRRAGLRAAGSAPYSNGLIDCAAPLCRALMLVCLCALALPGCSDKASDSGSEHAEARNQSDAGAASASPTVDGMVDGRAIRRRVIGHTVTGTMFANSRYREYYAPGGTIRGPGYRAGWTIEGERLCLDYDDASDAACYGLEIDGDAVRWHRHGEVQGRGTLTPGNPGAF